MVELNATFNTFQGTRLAWAQFVAIAWLRWRVFVNGFRRRGGVAELIGRVLLLPFVMSLVLLPAALAGFFSWYLSMHGDMDKISLVFWGAFVLTQLLNINLGQPGTTLDPTELIRFPLTLRNYVFVRLCFGLLSPGNLVITLMSVAAFIGITIDRPSLWPWTLLATGSFALANVLFSRMVFAWVDRWLSTRRAREVFTGFIFAASLGFQYLNVTYNPGFQHGSQHALTPEKVQRAQTAMMSVHHWLQWLPPELSGAAIIAAAHSMTGSSVVLSCAVMLYAVAFMTVYALRMHVEYRGEALSDAANAVAATPRALHREEPAATETTRTAMKMATGNAQKSWRRLPPSLLPLLGKELLVLRRNTGLLYGVIAPTVMVFLFAGRLSMHGGSQRLLLIAVGYALLGLAPMSYNSFGLEGPGAQFYFMVPVSLRDVFLAKNTMHFLLALFEVGTVIVIVSYVAGLPTAAAVLFVLFWATGTLLLNTALGNLRSVSAPKKVSPGKSMNRAQSQVSVWIAIGVLAACTGVGALFQVASAFFHQVWLGVGLAVVFAMAGLGCYVQGLRSIEDYTLQRRETLLEELGKKA